ncbi:MAG: sulfate adenylyltransferase [Pseudomonadota bacterium]
MIKPYGSDKLNPLYIMDDKARAKAADDAKKLKAILVSSAAAGNAVMLAGGYFNPLKGFMKKADVLSVAKDMKMADGLMWPTPIVNMVKDAQGIKVGDKIALKDPNVDGNPIIAVQEVTEVATFTEDEMKMVTEKVFGTLDQKHPGVSAYNTVGNINIAGPIQVLNFSYFDKEFADTFRTGYQIRADMEKLGWKKIVAFQTRNPMHLAHEELCRMAYNDLKADGILIHMLLGKLKAGDIPADVRDDCIRVMVDHYFPKNTVMVTGYGFDMLYAGPREAVLHAIFRQNCGCTHLIVGRDHAGVGDYYGPFDAQTIFDNPTVKNALQLDIFRADHTAWSKKLGKVVMMKDAPDHTKEDWILLSGTKVREMLGNGQAPPPEFSRPEVAKILITYYQKIDGKK